MGTPSNPSGNGGNSNERVSFALLTPNNLGTVRKLNSVLFPIKYTEKFYQDVLSPEVEDFCKLIYYNDIPVGTVCCRLENTDGRLELYIMTMGVLAPYRSRGLGSQSLKLVLANAGRRRGKAKIERVYLHVQVSNEEGKRFYERHGFVVGRVHADYYRKLQPRDAWVLEKTVIEDPEEEKEKAAAAAST